MLTKKKIMRLLEAELKQAGKAEKYLFAFYSAKNKLLTETYSEIISNALRNGNQSPIRNIFETRKMEKMIEEISREIAKESEALAYAYLSGEYMRVSTEIFKEFGQSPSFHLYSDEYIKEAISRNFKDGKKFSERIWGNTHRMEQELRKTLTDALTSGESVPITSRKFSDIMGAGFKESRRVIRTETIATYTRASLDSYNTLGVKQVEFIAEADACPDCLALEDKYDIKDAEIGTNMAPIHPFCRCSVIPVIND